MATVCYRTPAQVGHSSCGPQQEGIIVLDFIPKCLVIMRGVHFKQKSFMSFQFVLLVGDSHLRSIADGIVKVPDGGQRGISFGVMSTPGACARQLRTELVVSVLPRTPDTICVTYPTNCLMASCTVEEDGADFALLLQSAPERCSTVHSVFFLLCCSEAFVIC